jgi:hypothetical protein
VSEILTTVGGLVVSEFTGPADTSMIQLTIREPPLDYVQLKRSDVQELVRALNEYLANTEQKGR